MEAEVIDLIRQLNDFQIRFSATKVSKSIALQLMQPLEKLMNHISSFYIMPEELPRGKRKITDYTCSSGKGDSQEAPEHMIEMRLI